MSFYRAGVVKNIGRNDYHNLLDNASNYLSKLDKRDTHNVVCQSKDGSVTLGLSFNEDDSKLVYWVRCSKSHNARKLVRLVGLGELQ